MEWKTVKLGEIGEVVGGATPLTKNPVYYDGEISWITPKDLANYSDRYISRGERNITEEGYKSCSCKMLPKGSVLFSSRAPIGYIAIAENDLCTNQGFKSIIPNADKVDNVFLFYLLKQYKDYIAGLGSGTTFMEVSGSVMKNIELPLPPLDTQRRIAAILSSLDDKIENNNRINRNLEAQAQALFKSWFVDFEPWGGIMPEDWKEGTLESITDKIASGGTPKSMNKQFYIGNIKWFSTKELTDSFLIDSEKHISEDAYKNSAAKMFPAGTVLMAIYAAPTVGRLGILLNEATFNQAAVGMIAKTEIGKEYLYLLLKSERTKLNNLASGAAQQNLNVGIVKNYPIIVPHRSVSMDFQNMVKPLFDQIANNQKESHRLATLRDTLLPKLMKGEVIV